MAQNPIVGLIAQRVAAYNQAHPQRRVDLRAALAVAAQEGLSGGVGDNGTSFGPWQLHQGGALPSSVGLARGQQWASSPQGIDYAVGRIGGVAGGLQGRQAVNAIVSQFERPANPGSEIASALAAYGSTPAGGYPTAPPAAAPLAPSSGPTMPTQSSAADTRRQFANQLLGGISATGQLNQDALVAALTQRRQAMQAAPAASTAAVPPPAPTTPAGSSSVGGGIARTALTQLGTPYQWGGPAKLGSRTDCSGLLQASAAANGIKIGRTTYQQYQEGQPVALTQLQPGDAVFSHPTKQGPGHVSIYIGGGRVVEDPHTGASVEISQLARNGIVGARRYS